MRTPRRPSPARWHYQPTSPEVDVTLSLPHHANTNHVASDRWDVSCDALVNGQSMHSRLAIGQDDTICITPHDDNDDEFVVYGGQLV